MIDEGLKDLLDDEDDVQEGLVEGVSNLFVDVFLHLFVEEFEEASSFFLCWEIQS